MAHPNLLFLFTDEQRADTMAAYGNRRIQTPNLNKLAAESVVVEQAYVTQPVCTPSRSSIMTGLWPHTNGCTENNVPLSPDTPCLPEMVQADYASAYHGKWHLGDEIFAQHGFDEWRAIEDGYVGYYRAGRDRAARSDYHHSLIGRGLTPANGSAFGRGEATRLPEEYGKPAFLAREASRFIRENKGRPFILYVNFLEPHMPFFGPRDDQHDPAEVTLPANFDNPPTDAQPIKARAIQRLYRENGFGGNPLETEADWRRLIANYWGLCSLVDTHVGAILDTLDDCGLRDNTIVVYTSDHGDMMGSHRLLAKCVMFEEAVRVPLLLRLPGQGDGRRVTGPVSQIDLVPTLLDLMGEPIPDHLEGQSIRGLLEAGGHCGRDAFIEWNGPNCGVRKTGADHSRALAGLDMDLLDAGITDPVRTVVTPEGWKLNCSPLGEHELYNLGDDPLERCNRAGEREQRPLLNDLWSRVVEWQESTGDDVNLPDPGQP